MFPDFNNSMEGLARRKKSNLSHLTEKERRDTCEPRIRPTFPAQSPLITDVNVLKRQIIILCNYKCNQPAVTNVLFY